MPKLYNPRHPERTLLYRTVAEHFEPWHALASAGQFDGQGDHHTPRAFVRQAFAHGLARARCDDCGHDYFVAYSCYAQRETMCSCQLALDRKLWKYSS